MEAVRQRFSVEKAIDVLSEVGQNRLVCVAVQGFSLAGDEAAPSTGHSLDLSSVTGRSPETNASLAIAAIERWPDDPSAFAVELVMVSDAHPCPCCGYTTFDQPPGSYGICDICFWEDDAVQLRWPTYPGGANNPNLIDAQQNFLRTGAIEERFTKYVRAPSPDEPSDEGWRVINLSVDSFETAGVKERDWPEELGDLYWWRSTFWRRSTSS